MSRRWFSTWRDGPNMPELVALPPTNLQLADGRVLASCTGFCIGRFAVTFEEYDAFCGERGLSFPDDADWGRDVNPVIHVNLHDAELYCAHLTEHTGRLYRLPTADEWELAARAGSTDRFWWGAMLEPADANYLATTGYGTFSVHSLTPNPWGLYNTVGNVAEWVSDERAGFDDGLVQERTGPLACVRGGHWASSGDTLAVDLAECWPADQRTNRIGFRVAASL